MDFTDPHFAEPLRLWALVPAWLVLAGLFLHARRARARGLAAVASPAMLARLLGAHSSARRFAKEALLTLAVTLVILALARPCWGVEQLRSTGMTEDIIFAVDTSRSMTAKDVAPSRLERAKRAVSTFVGLHPSGRIGLLAFAGEAFVQCPPTADRDIFAETLDALDTTVIPTPGTDIGAALESAFTAFGERSGRRTIILVTDGEDLAADGVTTAAKLARKGVVVHTVAVGSPGGYEIPSSTGGGVVVTRPDEKTLREIATVTGGGFFRIDGAETGFRAVEGGLAQITSTGNMNRTPTERFAFPLAAACALLAAEGLLGTRRRRASGFSARSASAPALLALLVLLAPREARAGEAEKLYDSGTRAIARGDFGEAESSLRQAVPLADDALRPAIINNLGQARARSAAKNFAARTPADPALLLGKTLDSAMPALETVDKLLAEGDAGAFDENAGIAAYQNAVRARKALRKQLKDTAPAIEAGPAAMKTLERARDDFRSAAELAPVTPGATRNAKAVDDYLEQVRKTVEKEKKKKEEGEQSAKALSQKIKALKKFIPPDKRKTDSPGDDADEDEEEGEDKQGEKQSGKDTRSEQEKRKGEGREKKLSKEEALSALEALRNETNRRVNIGAEQKKPSPENNSKDW